MERPSIEEREEAALKALEARQKARGALSLSKMLNSNYLDSPELKSFNAEIRKKGFEKARKPIKLGTVDETNQEIQDYFDLCDKYSQLPSIKSLCLYLGISTSTFNSYLREADSEYGELFRAAIDFIHSVIEGGAMNNKVNPAVYMFTASNFYGMRDSKQIELSAVAPSQNNSMSSRESLNALREQVEKEKEMNKVENSSGKTIDAEFVEKVVEHE